MKQRVHIRVQGKVQGVCFRMCTREEAERLGLTGWVRNCHDGSVEIVAEGDPGNLAELVRWCHHGPPFARVRSVQDDYSTASGEFRDFGIEH